MFLQPLQYDEPLFRPPGEARSAILQVTTGCSWNKCAFCEMYTSKQFKIKSFEELKPEIKILADFYRGVSKKVFLADGDAFVLPAKRLIPVLEEIRSRFGRLQRISSYAMPKDILSKSDDELKELRELGLKLLYIGIESGDDELLKLVNKGETFDSTVEGIRRAHNSAIDTSIIIINGLGGRLFSEQHALGSAKIISRVNPRFLSTLTLSLPYGLEHFQSRFKGEYIQQTIVELYKELKVFIENLDVENVIYRSNHVSNNLVLEGTLSKDNPRLLKQIDEAIQITPGHIKPSLPLFL